MVRTGNRLLDLLSPPLLERILQVTRAVDLPISTSLYVSEASPSHIFFLTQGAASQVITTAEAGSVEVGMIGLDGAVGASALMGPAPSPESCFMQVSGAGLRLRTSEMKALFNDSAELRCRVLEFAQAELYCSGQASACNCLHEAEPRLARWLLTTADVSRLDSMDLTQQFLSEMLGTQRTTVSVVAGVLQQRGLIGYSRGRVMICDREGLTAAACDCYRITRAIMRNLYLESYDTTSA